MDQNLNPGQESVSIELKPTFPPKKDKLVSCSSPMPYFPI